MTKIIYFVTPITIAKIGNKAAEFVPILGPSLEFTKKAKKITQMIDPVSASSRRIGILFNYWKAGAVFLECTLWLGYLAAEDATCNPGLIALNAQFGNMIIDNIIV